MKKLNRLIKKYVLKHFKYKFEEFIPNSAGSDKQINELIEFNIKNTNINIIKLLSELHTLKVEELSNIKVDQFYAEIIANLFNKYNSDKNSHGYDKLYAYLIKNINKIENLLEIGIGSTSNSSVSSMGSSGTSGASLRAFSELLPAASIYGADNDRSILFNNRNISSIYLDQNNFETFSNLNDLNIKFDLIIDDGLHMQAANLNTLRFAMKNLSKVGYLVIEDVAENALNVWFIVQKIISPNFELRIIKCTDNFVVLVNISNH